VSTSILAGLHQRRGYVLQVAGLRFRYSTNAGIADGAAGLPTSVSGDAGNLYKTLPLIAELGNYRASIDIAGGVADYEPINIRLGTDGRRAVDGDPGTIFGRLLPRSLASVAQIAATLSQTGTTVTVDTTASITAGQLIHVGAECMAVASVDDGTTLTVVRGVGGTVARVHAVDTVSATAPDIYAEPATWLARRATLYACGMTPEGRRSTGFVEVYRGIIDTTPTVDGDSVLLVLAPLTSLLDVGLGPPVSETLLLQGWHFYTPPVASSFRVGVEFADLTVDIDGPTEAGPPVVWPLFPEDVARLAASFDVQLTDGTLLVEPAHPRALTFNASVFDVGVYADEWTDAAPPASRGVEGGTLTHVAPGITPRRVRTGVRQEGRNIPIDAGAQRWPEVLRQSFIDNAAPGTTAGLAGLHMNFRLDLDAADPAIAITMGAYTDDWTGVGLAYVWPSSIQINSSLIRRFPDWTTGQPLALAGFPESLSYPLSFSDPERNIGAGTSRAGRVGYVSGDRQQAIAADVRGSDATRIPLAGIARAYYQTGEPDILVETDLGVSVGDLRIRIDYPDPETGDTLTAECTITASTPVVVDAVTIGYRLTIAERDRFRMPSFGDWPGLDRVRITPVLAFEAEDIGVVVGTILRSAGGASPGTFDRAPYGVGLRVDEVDIASFRSMVPPPGAAQWSLRAEPGVSARELIDPLLQAAGYALTMRISAAGKCRLTAVALGYEGDTEAVGSLDTRNVGARATWASDDRIANHFVYAVNWNAVTGKSERSVTVDDLASQARYQDVARLSFELRGLRVLDGGADAAVVLRSMYLRHRALLADPRRIWRVAVGNGPGLFADLGAVYRVTHPHLRGYGDRVTHPHLRGYGDAVGVVSAAGRVVEVEVGLQSEPTSLTLQHYGARAAGWNASAVLSAAPAGLVLTVSANVYAGEESVGARDAQVDASGFQDGDEVLIAAPWAADAVGAAVTVTNVDGNTITVDAVPVGATTGWVIWPAAYGVASERHKGYAYHADVDGTVGADPGVDIV